MGVPPQLPPTAMVPAGGQGREPENPLSSTPHLSGSQVGSGASRPTSPPPPAGSSPLPIAMTPPSFSPALGSAATTASPPLAKPGLPDSSKAFSVRIGICSLGQMGGGGSRPRKGERGEGKWEMKGGRRRKELTFAWVSEGRRGELSVAAGCPVCAWPGSRCGGK